MSAFDKIIGYDSVKEELMQICDMLHNKDIYSDVGARLPRGLLLYGNPGLGKTFMVKAFIEESGITTFTLRRHKGNDDFVGMIADTFEEAKKNTPCIVFLDDIDKFANDDYDHRDAEEYVSVQSGIDEVSDTDVFVIATANDMGKLPDSLLRAGRFDRKIEITRPTQSESEKIIRYYLADKKLSKDADMDDIVKMINYSSCAELESMVNEAAVNTAFDRRKEISRGDFIKSVLKAQYNSPEVYNSETDTAQLRRIAVHEAGHAVVSEVLCSGSVGMISLLKGSRVDRPIWGYVKRCKELPLEEYKILIHLGGKVALELNDVYRPEDGCGLDIATATEEIRDQMNRSGVYGYGMIDAPGTYKTSDDLFRRSEIVVQAELHRYAEETKKILLENKEFLDKVTEALFEKATLLASDIKKIRDELPQMTGQQ